ncbi:MAG TPA: OmpA family protein [Terriglobales bacterium]
MSRKVVLTVALSATIALSAAAQSDAQSEPADANSTQPQSSTIQVTPMQQTPTYRVSVTERSTSAVDYRHRAGSTKVEMKGTELAPEIKGDAKVNSKAGRLDVNASLEHMRNANSYGPQFLTYVLWAITPTGRPTNLGEVLPNDDGKAGLHVTTALQSFGLIVTAEPYFAVTRPSDMVVAENVVTYNTKGWEQPITAKFEALNRGEYTVDINAEQLPASTADRQKVPLELLEARNAVAIAKASGAQQYAPDVLQKAQEFLAKGEDYLQRKQGRSAIGTVTRYAAQQAEDARVLTIRRKQEELAANERREMQQRTDEARQRAEEARQQAQDEAERAKLAQEQRDQAQQERQAAEQAKLEAQQAAQQAAQERAAAEQARQQALQEQQNLRMQVQQAQNAAQQAEMEREQTRQRLLTQLNQVLQTKDTARGLIVNMSDVLFDFNKATLKPGARERLARVAGVVLAYPDLRLQIEGYTDNVGSDTYNMQLSEKRAETVRNYLVSQGVNANNITARGFGETAPVASNDSPAGRQQNRRVELVVSGEAIQANGHTPGGPAGTPGTTATGTTSTHTYTNQTTTTTQPMPSQPAAETNQPMTQPDQSQPVGTQPTYIPPANNAPVPTSPSVPISNAPNGTNTSSPPQQ